MDARTKRAWTGLTRYANGEATATEIASTVAACMGWVSAVVAFGLFDWIAPTELATQAQEYRHDVDSLLRFLCSGPQSAERASLRSRAQTFLFEHGPHIEGLRLTEVRYNQHVNELLQKFGYSSAEREKFREDSERIWSAAKYGRRGQPTLAGTDLLPLGINVPSREYRDIADPICDFLMSEYQKYLNRESDRRDKKAKPVIPIFVCPRCNKLVMPERTGRKTYCSGCTDLARAAKYRKKAPLAEGRDYQWLYRLKQKQSPLRKVFLRNQRNQMRLQQIKSRQRESSRCQRILLEMNL